MYFQDYMVYGCNPACMIFSGIASGKVKTSFNKHNQIRCRSGLTGYDIDAKIKLLASSP